MKRFQKFTGGQQERLFQEERMLNIQWARGQQSRGVQRGGTITQHPCLGTRSDLRKGHLRVSLESRVVGKAQYSSPLNNCPTLSLSEGTGPIGPSHGDHDRNRTKGKSRHISGVIAKGVEDCVATYQFIWVSKTRDKVGDQLFGGPVLIIHVPSPSLNGAQ